MWMRLNWVTATYVSPSGKVFEFSSPACQYGLNGEYLWGMVIRHIGHLEMAMGKVMGRPVWWEGPIVYEGHEERVWVDSRG